MTAMISPWSHQVEIKVDQQSACERLRRIESWCAGWEIGFRSCGPMATGSTMRIAFEEARFARAFHAHFGGVILPVGEIELVMEADARDDYERLAREFPEDA